MDELDYIIIDRLKNKLQMPTRIECPSCHNKITIGWSIRTLNEANAGLYCCHCNYAAEIDGIVVPDEWLKAISELMLIRENENYYWCRLLFIVWYNSLQSSINRPFDPFYGNTNWIIKLHNDELYYLDLLNSDLNERHPFISNMILSDDEREINISYNTIDRKRIFNSFSLYTKYNWNLILEIKKIHGLILNNDDKIGWTFLKSYDGIGWWRNRIIPQHSIEKMPNAILSAILVADQERKKSWDSVH